MNRNNRITLTNFTRLRCGQTVWRCLIGRDGMVSIREILLTGSKGIDNEYGLNSVRIARKGSKFGGNFLADVRGHGDGVAAFTSRRAALKWKEQVEAGYDTDAAMDHHAFCDMMDEDLNDYDHLDDGGPYNGLEDACGPCDCEDCKPSLSTEPMTLGKLLQLKLERDAAAANDTSFALTA